MKVRITYTIDADEVLRRAIRAYYDEPGLATREEVVSWYRNCGEAMNIDLQLAQRREAT